MSDRDEREQYRGDVWYEEWRRGLPEGSLSDDRIDDGYYDGMSPESLVREAAVSRMSRYQEEQVQEFEQEFEQ
jgi:hypothetical protein